MLLWHGSRLTNWVGILNQGLRIAPPEAPVTGYMASTKAEQYFKKLLITVESVYPLKKEIYTVIIIIVILVSFHFYSLVKESILLICPAKVRTTVLQLVRRTSAYFSYARYV